MAAGGRKKRRRWQVCVSESWKFVPSFGGDVAKKTVLVEDFSDEIDDIILENFVESGASFVATFWSIFNTCVLICISVSLYKLYNVLFQSNTKNFKVLHICEKWLKLLCRNSQKNVETFLDTWDMHLTAPS